MKTAVALGLIGAVLLGGWYISKPHYSASGTPNDVNTEFQKALQNETDPKVLRSFAADLRAKGYTAQATALEAKAATIEANNKVLPGPTGIPPMPAPPAVIPVQPPVAVTPTGGVVINVPAPPDSLGGSGNFLVNAGPPSYMLRVRSSPNNVSDANIVTGLPDGTVVTQTGGPTNVGGIAWVQIRNPVNGVNGWVASQYLKPVGLAA
jgi:hypothetical protein